MFREFITDTAKLSALANGATVPYLNGIGIVKFVQAVRVTTTTR